MCSVGISSRCYHEQQCDIDYMTYHGLCEGPFGIQTPVSAVEFWRSETSIYTGTGRATARNARFDSDRLVSGSAFSNFPVRNFLRRAALLFVFMKTAHPFARRSKDAIIQLGNRLAKNLQCNETVLACTIN